MSDAIRDIRLDRAEDFGRAGERTVVGDPYEGLKLAYLHISTIQIGTISDMLLCDTESSGILITTCFPQFPPIVEALVLQKGQPPPGWPFCVSRGLALSEWANRRCFESSLPPWQYEPSIGFRE